MRVKMEKTSVMPDCSPAFDIDSYREPISSAVGLEVSELMDPVGKDPNLTMRRRYAAYILSQHDNLRLGEIGSVLADSESFVRGSIDEVGRRTYKYRALSLLVEQMAAGYALARAGKPSSEEAGVAVESFRQRIANAVWMTLPELLAFERDNDAELTQKVASFLLLSRDGLSVAAVAQVMLKDEEWVRFCEVLRSAPGLSRDRDWKKYVEETTATYDVASKQAANGDRNSWSSQKIDRLATERVCAPNS